MEAESIEGITPEEFETAPEEPLPDPNGPIIEPFDDPDLNRWARDKADNRGQGKVRPDLLPYRGFRGSLR
jgi:hypothetical protein